MIKSVAIILAMHDEAKPLIHCLNLKSAPKLDSCLPMEVFISDDKKIILAINGVDPHFNVDCIGTQPAAITTTLIIREYQPDLIISAGTAGAFKNKGAAIGDVYVSKQIAFHDRRIALPGFDKYGQCIIETPEGIAIAEKLHFKTGNITSGNSLDAPEQDLKTIQEMNGEIKEMEAAATAWIARLYGKKVFAVKSVTDLIDNEKPTEEEFMENLHMASAALKDGLLAIIPEVFALN